MIRSLPVFVVLALSGALFVANSPLAQPDQAAIVKERQDRMRSMGKSFGPLVAILKGESDDFAAAAAAAQTMNDNIAKSQSLFPAGTAKGEVAESRAKPEVWTESVEFAAAGDKLIEATATMVEVANSGDLEAFKVQFQVLADACGGCHEAKGSAGGKFRFPEEN